LDDPQGSNVNCGDKTVISGLHCYASDCSTVWATITVSGVGGDFSQTETLVTTKCECNLSLITE